MASSSQKRIRENSDIKSGPSMEGRKRQKGNQKSNDQKKKNKNKPFDFLEELHAPEWDNAGPDAAHRFEVSLRFPSTPD